MPVAVVHRHQSWIGLSDESLLWKLGWHFLVPRKLVLWEEAVRSVPALGPVGPVSEVHGVFSNRDLPSISGGANQGQ